MIPLYYSPDVSSLLKFEMIIKDWFQYPHVLALDSGTSCWFLLSILLKIDNCNIFCSPITKLPPFIKHFWKNNIVYIDVEFDTGYMDIIHLSQQLCDSKLNIILIQHWNGYTCDMSIYNKLKNSNTIIIEDCSSLIGNIPRISQCNNIAVFEINNQTPLCTITGGLLVFPNPELYTKCITLLDTCYPALKMNDVTAHQGLNSVNLVCQRYEACQLNAKLLDTVLDKFEYLEPCFPFDDSYTYPTFGIKINSKGNCANSLVNFFLEHKIQASALVLNSVDFDNATDLYNHTVLIPCGFWVDTNILEKIIQTLASWYKMYFNNITPRLIETTDYHKGLFQLLNHIENIEDKKLSMSVFKNLLEINFHKFIYVIEMDGKIVAHAILTIDYNQWFKSKAYIEYIIIHPDYRERGLGKKLIQHVIKACYEQHDGPSDNIYIANMNYPNEFLSDLNFYPTSVTVWKYENESVKPRSRLHSTSST